MLSAHRGAAARLAQLPPAPTGPGHHGRVLRTALRTDDRGLGVGFSDLPTLKGKHTKNRNAPAF